MTHSQINHAKAWGFSRKEQIKIGNIVTLPRKWTFGRRKFQVIHIFKNGDLKLKFLGGKERGESIERYGQDEVIRL